MEVPSSRLVIESNLNFNPDTFIQIGKDGLNKKIDALKKYKGILWQHHHNFLQL